MKNMKQFRKKAALTQEKLAELCDTDPCYIRQIESGRRFPSVAYIERIATALRIAPYRLFYDDGADPADIPIREVEQKRLLEAALIEEVSRSIRLVIDRLS